MITLLLAFALAVGLVVSMFGAIIFTDALYVQDGGNLPKTLLIWAVEIAIFLAALYAIMPKKG